MATKFNLLRLPTFYSTAIAALGHHDPENVLLSFASVLHNNI